MDFFTVFFAFLSYIQVQIISKLSFFVFLTNISTVLGTSYTVAKWELLQYTP